MCKNPSHLFLLLVLLFGCAPDKKPNTLSIKEELAQRELIHITEGEIMAKGEMIGSKIVASTQHSLSSALQNAIQKEGIIGAINFCQLNAYPLIIALEDSLDVDIKRVSQKIRNRQDQPDSIELEILKAYAYHFSPTNDLNQIQVLDASTLIYTQPIAITNGLCLNCHGKIGETLTNEVYEQIKLRYPNDEAIGYSLGELRGMWSIKIPKKTVINQL